LDRRLPQLAVEGHEERYLSAPLIPHQPTAHTDPQAHAALQTTQ
jgi:hypothetical protein